MVPVAADVELDELVTTMVLVIIPSAATGFGPLDLVSVRWAKGATMV